MAKFKVDDQVEDAHGNEYTVLEVETSTGRIAVEDNNTGRQYIKQDWELK